MPCAVIGTGSYLPPRVVTNEEAGQLARIEPARIERLFNIRRRHWTRGVHRPDPTSGQACSDLAAEAGRRAIAAAGIEPGRIDTVIAVSATPDAAIPPLDYLVITKLGLQNTRGLTIHAPCTGIFRAALIADSLVRAGQSETVLLVAAEAISPFFRFDADAPEDHRLNTVLFADGAGGMLLTATNGPQRIEALRFQTTGDPDSPGVTFPGMFSAYPPTPERLASMDYLGHHDFRRVLDRGIALTKRAAEETLVAAGTTYTDYRWLLTHQATGNLRKLGVRIGIPAEKLAVNIERVGNTISASILILLDELSREGQIAAGDRLLLVTAESSTWSYGGMSIVW